MKTQYIFILIIALIIAIPSTLSAKKRVVTEDEVTAVTTESGKSIYCFGEEPGTVKTKRGNLIFRPLKDGVKRAKKLFKKDSKNKKKFTRARKKFKEGVTACTSEEEESEVDYFDENGDTLDAFKEIFNIPTALTGNITRGEALYSEECSSCHGGNSEKTNRTFTHIADSIEDPPMDTAVGDLSDQDLADITAYLGRSY